MPRVKIVPEREFEFRLTPPSQEEVVDWKIHEKMGVLVVFREGTSNGTPKLHYHGYLKAKLSLKSIQRWLNDVAESDKYGVKGNAVFFTRSVHEHTFGYISKYRQCVVRHGTDQTLIEEWYRSSDEYVREKDAAKKRRERTRNDELQPIWDGVRKYLATCDRHTQMDEHMVITQVLYRCHEANVRFPTRAQMEAFVVNALYPYLPENVVNYFHRTFERRV